MLTASLPADGDVVVREGPRDTGYVYVLRTLPGPDQLVLPSYELAARHALQFARRHRVNAAVRLQES